MLGRPRKAQHGQAQAAWSCARQAHSLFKPLVVGGKFEKGRPRPLPLEAGSGADACNRARRSAAQARPGAEPRWRETYLHDACREAVGVDGQESLPNVAAKCAECGCLGVTATLDPSSAPLLVLRNAHRADPLANHTRHKCNDRRPPMTTKQGAFVAAGIFVGMRCTSYRCGKPQRCADLGAGIKTVAKAHRPRL